VFRTHNTAYTDARKTHNTVPVFTIVFLKMNPPSGSKHVEDIKLKNLKY